MPEYVNVKRLEDGKILEVSRKAYDTIFIDKPGFELVDEPIPTAAKQQAATQEPAADKDPKSKEK